MCVLFLRECSLRCRFDYAENFGLQLLVFHMTKCHMCHLSNVIQHVIHTDLVSKPALN